MAQLSEAQRRQAMTRWDVLRPFLSEGVPLTRAAAAAGVPCGRLAVRSRGGPVV